VRSSMPQREARVLDTSSSEIGTTSRALSLVLSVSIHISQHRNPAFMPLGPQASGCWLRVKVSSLLLPLRSPTWPCNDTGKRSLGSLPFSYIYLLINVKAVETVDPN
jgi:hypothetical protein